MQVTKDYTFCRHLYPTSGAQRPKIGQKAQAMFVSCPKSWCTGSQDIIKCLWFYATKCGIICYHAITRMQRFARRYFLETFFPSVSHMSWILWTEPLSALGSSCACKELTWKDECCVSLWSKWELQSPEKEMASSLEWKPDTVTTVIKHLISLGIGFSFSKTVLSRGIYQTLQHHAMDKKNQQMFMLLAVSTSLKKSYACCQHP